MGCGLNKDMDVLWHENIGDQSARLSVDGMIGAFRQEVSPFVVRQERHPAVAREGQLVAITGLMKSPDGLSMAAHGRRR